MSTLPLELVQTPCLLLDESRMLRNIARVTQHSEQLGVPLRPHVKTPKCAEIVRLMVNAPDRRITVSTLAEAEFFARLDYQNVLLTTPLAPGKIARVAALQRSGVELIGVVDNMAAALALEQAAQGAGCGFSLLVEINVDDFRGGVSPESPDFDDLLSKLLGSTTLRFKGLLFYAGSSKHTRSESERKRIAERYVQCARTVLTRLKDRGIECPIRSFGSTSVFMAADSLEVFTEHRGGIYAFQDLFQAGLGWCTADDIALTVAVTIIGHDLRRKRLFTDGGALALSLDRSTAGTPFDAKYGRIVDARSGVPVQDLWVSEVYQEHGIVTSASGGPIDFAVLPIGHVLAVQVNHADTTAAAHDRYHLVRGGVVVDVWQRVNGW